MSTFNTHIDTLGFEIPCLGDVKKVEEGTVVVGSQSPTPNKKKQGHGSGSSTRTKYP